MKIKITPSVLKGEITAPPSKSYAHRHIICACLSGGESVVENVGNSLDILATVRCMQAFGFDCELRSDSFYVRGFKKSDYAVADCGESGSTLRFLLPVACALGIKTEFIGSEKLLSRPNTALIRTLNDHGADIDGYFVKGKTTGSVFEIDASVSSQYVTGLLLAGVVTGEDFYLKVVGKRVSSGYVDITVDVLSQWGVEVEITSDGYFIKGGQKLTPHKEKVEGDFSGASFFLAAGCLGDKIRVNGLKRFSRQGDRAILDVLRDFGAKINWENGTVTVEKGCLNGINIDCENIPDIVQIIAVVAAFSSGKTVLKNIGRLAYKESDRIKAITDMLTEAKIKWESDGNTLTVEGCVPAGGSYRSGNDHRTAMSCAILAAYSEGASFIEGAEAVAKSYPDFYRDYKKMGGKTDVVV